MWDIILLVVLILLSGFFSGIEIAFMSLSKIKVASLLNSKAKNAEILQKLKRDPQRLLILILIGNNIVNIAASALATSLAINISISMGLGNAMSVGVGIATAVMTLIILIFGEITPKAYCTHNAEKVALGVSPAIMLLSKIMYPLVEVFNLITRQITRFFGHSKERPLITEEEVRNIVDIGEEEGAIKASEKEMINNIFRFDDITVGSIMVPRPDMFALDDEMTVSEVKDMIVDEGFSRIPVYRKELDMVVGVLYIKDLLKAPADQKIKFIVRPAIFVPETKKINSLFKEMNVKKTHISLVVDEHGTLVGLVTIEDLLEEIVGEIYDETDEIKHQFKRINPKTYLVDGDTEIKKVNRKLGLSIHGNVHKPISSFILDKLGRIPVKGESVVLPGCVVDVESVNKNRIDLVKLKLKKHKR